jgi:hypothetical protein
MSICLPIKVGARKDDEDGEDGYKSKRKWKQLPKNIWRVSEINYYREKKAELLKRTVPFVPRA